MKILLQTTFVRVLSLIVFGGGLFAASWFAGSVFAQTGNPYACANHPKIPAETQGGTCVQALQWLLKSKIPNLNLDVNGTFDTATQDAVILYQTGAGLKCGQDGRVGPETWNSLVPGLNQPGVCAAAGGDPSTTTSTTATSAGCSKIEQNFTEFGGSTAGPLANNCYTPGEAINKAIKLGFTLVGILCVLFIVIGGYRYMTSAGDEKRAGAGKKTIQWALIGLLVVLLAYTIIAIATRITTTNQLF